MVVIRQETKRVRYVVLSYNGKIWIETTQILKDNLSKKNDKVKKQTEIEQKLEVIADAVENNKPVPEEVDLKS